MTHYLAHLLLVLACAGKMLLFFGPVLTLWLVCVAAIESQNERPRRSNRRGH